VQKSLGSKPSGPTDYVLILFFLKEIFKNKN
jgi:hypothetical protein